MTYEVIFLADALIDIDDSYEYIASRSPQGAKRWLTALERAVDALETNPTRFAAAPENDLVKHLVQNVSFKTPKGRVYRLVFTLVGEQVRVVRMLGPGRQLLRAEELG